MANFHFSRNFQIGVYEYSIIKRTYYNNEFQ